jgi:hypothetical protein
MGQHPTAMQGRPERTRCTGCYHLVLLLKSKTHHRKLKAEKIGFIVVCDGIVSPTSLGLLVVSLEARPSDKGLRERLYHNKAKVCPLEILAKIRRVCFQKFSKLAFVERGGKEMKPTAFPEVVAEAEDIIPSSIFEVVPINIVVLYQNCLGADFLEIPLEIIIMRLQLCPVF